MTQADAFLSESQEQWKARHADEPAIAVPPAPAPIHIEVEKKSWFDKLEAFVSGLSVRDTFWHRICSLIWLPLAFFSGIRMRQLGTEMFTAVLPFSRFNRNW